MKKEEFLELASQLFDQTNLVKEEKIVLEENVMGEIIDQISSELYEESFELIEDYDLELNGNEIYLEGCRLNIRKLDRVIKEVLERYFVTK
jgi:hypothetical protein